MKTLKITSLLVAVLFLTLSGQSSDTLKKEDVNTYKKSETKFDALAHSKKYLQLPTNG
ncbi:hypothetical protein [Lacinutrix undariae]